MWIFYLKWYKFQLSLKAAVDLWEVPTKFSRKHDLSSAESKAHWVGEGMQKL